MKIKDATPEFKERYERWKKRLEALGLYNPGLSSLAKQYTKLDLEAQERSSLYKVKIDFSREKGETAAKKAASARKPKTKNMFAVVQKIVDKEDAEDSRFEIIGVYASEKAAKAALDKAREKFLLDVDDDLEEAEDIVDNDFSRNYEWEVVPVKAEA